MIKQEEVDLLYLCYSSLIVMLKILNCSPHNLSLDSPTRDNCLVIYMMRIENQ